MNFRITSALLRIRGISLVHRLGASGVLSCDNFARHHRWFPFFENPLWLMIVLLSAISSSSSVKADNPMPSDSIRPIIIAHRGASGYLPEHTLEAKAMAHGQGANYLEQDLVLTQDDVPIVLHDIHLDTVTDVATRFPKRAREDGRYYAIDFTLAEIRTLTVSERFHPQTGKAVFPHRFPPHQGRFHIPTFEEELRFIAGLNKSTGRQIGIYPEIKQPEFHRKEGKEITPLVIKILSQFGYTKASDPCFLQCFEQAELKRIRQELKCELQLVQLLGGSECRRALSHPDQLHQLFSDIAEYADGIGPPLDAIFTDGVPNKLVEEAHSSGLIVHPWTCRADQISAGFQTFEQLHQACLAAGVDGVFSDFPDQSQMLFESLSKSRSSH